VPVVVARAPIPRGKSFTARNSVGLLAERRVPARFAPPDALRHSSETAGLRTLTPIPPGGYVGAAQLGPPEKGGPAAVTEAGARLVQIPVAGASSLEGVARSGSLVDILITSDHHAGPPATYVALQRVELFELRPAGSDAAFGGEQGQGADGIATLRVSLRQAVMLTAAQNFARELRLVPRARGDRGRIGPIAVSAADLHP
jgi:pilus assembly protein CpaB